MKNKKERKCGKCPLYSKIYGDCKADCQIKIRKDSNCKFDYTDFEEMLSSQSEKVEEMRGGFLEIQNEYEYEKNILKEMGKLVDKIEKEE